VLGTTVGGIPDIVTDRKTGILVPPGDHKAAAAALEELLTDPEQRKLLASAGQENAEKYDWGVIAERYGELYRNC